MVSVGESRPMLEFCRGRSSNLSMYLRKSSDAELSVFTVMDPFLLTLVAATASTVVVRAWSRSMMYGDIKSCPSISP